MSTGRSWRASTASADATAGPADEEALRRLIAEGRSVLTSLAHHEQAENELLLRSIDDAVAAQD